jgi:carbonic anhydrase/acetyltransferase-like protein (isoleucine patch superfamily)
MKSVAGTVSPLGNGGHSLSLDVNDRGTKQTMQFVVDKDTQVEGQVKVGSAVTVIYVAMADQNVARNITIQG